MYVIVILLVLCLLVIECCCHWSQLKATYLLTYVGNTILICAIMSIRILVISATM